MAFLSGVHFLTGSHGKLRPNTEGLPFQREIAAMRRTLQKKMVRDGAKIKFNTSASDGDPSVEYGREL
jgi:hypothetical protein